MEQGVPEVLVSDNATCFTSEVFKEFTTKKFKVFTSLVYHPNSNGLAERALQTFKSGMKKITDGAIGTRFLRFLRQYRITPTSIGLSPAEMLNKHRFQSRT